MASGVPTLGVELSFGVKHELALTVQDLLDRRTRLGLVSGERDAATEPAQAILAAAERDPSQAVLVAGGQAAGRGGCDG